MAEVKGGRNWRRILLDGFLIVSLCGVAVYLIVDAQNKTEKKTEEESEFRDSVTICSNGKEKTPVMDFPRTALDEYVWRKDGFYGYEIVSNEYNQRTGLQTITVNFTSQEWLKDVNWYGLSTGTKVWWHWLTIFVPLKEHKKYNPNLLDTGMLLIDGGDNTNMLEPPTDDDIFVRVTRMMAEQTGSVTAVLKNVPNARVKFEDDLTMDSRREDDLIAYSWMRFINESGANPEMLVLMPMVKAAVLSFNATSDIVSKENACGPALNRYQCRPGPIDRWVPTGGSKRGWTTWLTAAVDYHRVKAMAPIVLSFLNMIENFHHYWRAYGGWSFAMGPYYNEGITKTLDNPVNVEAQKVFDPYFYKERLLMPKLIISTAGDEFFLPDDSYYWLSEMKGPTFFRLLPNAEHVTVLSSLTTKHYFLSIRHLFLQTMLGHDFPEYCTMRYTKTNGVKGVKFMSNDQLRGIDAFVTDTRDRVKRDYRLIALNPDSNTDQSTVISPANLTHYQFNPYTYETSEMPLQQSKAKFQIQPNIWRKFPAKRAKESEYTYEYFVELDPSEAGYRAMLLNIQFMGSYDDLGWIEVTSEIQFTEDNIHPFDACHGAECYGALV